MKRPNKDFPNWGHLQNNNRKKYRKVKINVSCNSFIRQKFAFFLSKYMFEGW